MKVLKYVVFAGIVLVVCLGARSPRNEGDYRERVERFLTAVMEKKLDAAFNGLTEGSDSKERREALDTLKIRTETAVSLLGKPSGMEFIRSQTYGESVVRLVYIIKYDLGPLVWEFYFYRPQNEWKFVGIEFSDRMSLLGER